MRVAVLADIHGNLTALDAVLDDLAGADADAVVCLGDVAAIGPQPHEVIARMRDLGCPVVMGNTDASSLRPVRLSPLDEESRRYVEIENWGAGQLTAEDRDFIRGFPPTLTVPLGDGATLLCFHGSPRGNTDSIVATTPDATLARMLTGFSATVMAGGHTHGPFVRPYRRALFVNPGSVGLPYEAVGERVRHPPWAEYGIVEWRAGRLGVELRRVPFDADLVVQAVLRSGMPHAEWLANRWR
jgi:predicted phosphodiesterase